MRCRARSAAVLACLLGAVSGATAGGELRHFNLPSQDLVSALNALGAAADEQLLFSADLVRGLRSEELRGDYTFISALTRLLEGTGLRADRTRAGVVLIVRDATPPPAAQSSVTAGVAATSPPSQQAEQAITAVQALGQIRDPRLLEEVRITGKRVGAEAYDAVVPMAIVDSGRIEAEAATNVVQALNQVPAFKATTTPTTNGVRAATPGASYADLRGLGSARTLVLVDGKRFVPQIATALAAYQVDLNQIPTLLVERAEAVTGGASAQWGSDALAGVVNVVLKKNFQGFRADAQAGASEYGDDQEYRLGMLAGTSLLGGRAHIEAAFDYVRNDGTGDVYTRPWGRAGYQLAGNPCSVLATPAQLGANGCAGGSNGLARNLILPDVRFGNLAPGGLILDTMLRGTQFGPGGTPLPFEYGSYAGAGGTMQGGDAVNLGENINTGISMGNYVRRLGTYARFAYHFTDEVSAYVESSLSHTAGGGQTLPSRDAGLAVDTIQVDNAFLPQSIRDEMRANGIGSFTLGRVNRDLGYQQMRQDNRTVRVVGGLEGSLSNGWNWDASYAYGANDYELRDAPNRILDNYRLAIDSVVDPANGEIVCRSSLTNPGNGCQPLNLFGEGSPSQAAIDYVTAETWNRTDYRQHSLAASASGTPFNTWAGPVSFTAGAGYRAEHQTSRVDPIANALRYDSTNSRPLDGGFDVTETYLDAVVPLTEGVQGSNALALNGAIRMADYSTSAGRQWPWKIGLAYNVSPSLMLRTARSRDIRAPNIFELHSLPIFNTTNVAYDGQIILVRQDSSGNPDLRPEQGDTFTLGAAYTPAAVPGLQLSVDYFDIDVRNVIAQRNLQQIANFCSGGTPQERQFYCSLFTFSEPGDTNSVPTHVYLPYENLSESIRSGVDFSAAYERRALDGLVSVKLDGNYLEHYQTDMGTGLVERAGDLQGSPRLRGTLALSYDRTKLSLTASARYIGAMRYDNTFVEGRDINDNSIPAIAFFDFSARYDTSPNLQLFGAVRNLFDKAPPYAPTSFGYPTNPVFYDVIGRTYRVGFRYELAGR
ncbi:MAG: TonB-dependent receptor [Gammaproteobacteria bacterium]